MDMAVAMTRLFLVLLLAAGDPAPDVIFADGAERAPRAPTITDCYAPIESWEDWLWWWDNCEGVPP